MPMPLPFTSQFAQDELEGVLKTIEAAAYDHYVYQALLRPALMQGLAACDDGKRLRMLTSDIYAIAETLGVDTRGAAVIEAFIFGAAIAITESLDEACRWMLDNEDDFFRIARYRSDVEDELIDVEEVLNDAPVNNVMTLIDSYVTSEQATAARDACFNTNRARLSTGS